LNTLTLPLSLLSTIGTAISGVWRQDSFFHSSIVALRYTTSGVGIQRRLRPFDEDSRFPPVFEL
jgi:hypothetical protein